MINFLASIEDLLPLGLDARFFRRSQRGILELADEMLRRSGEASGSALALELIEEYQTLDREKRTELFRGLLDDYGPDEGRLQDVISAYQDAPSPQTAEGFLKAAESRRMDLFRLINTVPGGTRFLIKMREDLFVALRDNPDLKPVDRDFEHLFGFWFNKGFLELRQLDWETPAYILEKLIEYEAVHEIRDWNDLRRRLQSDRRCFAFFHPALPGEPLIFVEVALTNGLASSIQAVLNEPVAAAEEKIDTAIFYSISNCHTGLRSVSFGDSLLKQVVGLLQDEFPTLKKFATLSPVPGFMRWLAQENAQLADAVKSVAMTDGSQALEEHREQLMRQCAKYLLYAKRGIYPADPVARFHLRNGAILHAMHWGADTSERGLRQSGGIMVNYLYEQAKLVNNHEAFVSTGMIPSSADITLLTRP
ncbi:MAG: malonyl-CoA decarboxylase [Alphaproteobacteria bacterium]